jgi:DNA-binding transcriptional regulator YiaG
MVPIILSILSHTPKSIKMNQSLQNSNDGEWTFVPYTKKSKRKTRFVPSYTVDPNVTILNGTEKEKTKKVAGDTTGAYSKKNSDTTYDARKMHKVDVADSAYHIDRVSNPLGQTISATRTAQKMTQDELAAACNLPVSIIKTWENSTAVYDPSTMTKIASVLKVTLRK